MCKPRVDFAAEFHLSELPSHHEPASSMARQEQPNFSDLNADDLTEINMSAHMDFFEIVDGRLQSLDDQGLPLDTPALSSAANSSNLKVASLGMAVGPNGSARQPKSRTSEQRRAEYNRAIGAAIAQRINQMNASQ